MVYNMSKACVQIRSRFFCTSEEKIHQFQSNNGGHDRGSTARMAYFKLPSILTKSKRC